MSERYNPKSGIWEPQSEPTELVLPRLTDYAKEKALELFDESKLRTGDAVDFVDSEEEKIQKRVKAMADKGLFMANPDMFINFSEQDLPAKKLLEIMGHQLGDKQDISNEKYRMTYLYKNRQNLSTGGVLLMDKELQMNGETQAVMSKRAAAL